VRARCGVMVRYVDEKDDRSSGGGIQVGAEADKEDLMGRKEGEREKRSV